MQLFRSRRPCGTCVRYTLPGDDSTLLVTTDGAYLENGQAYPRAGWAFMHGLDREGEPLVASGRLEDNGPWGDSGKQTSNGAELRAVLAALRFRAWETNGFKAIVIATDSEYVVQGATKWAKSWVRNGWRTRDGDVKNKDLWEALLDGFDTACKRSLSVKFWRIPRECNTLADAGANKAALKGCLSSWSGVVDKTC